MKSLLLAMAVGAAFMPAVATAQSSPMSVNTSEITDWVSIGTGRYVDGFATQAYGGLGPAVTVRVDIEESQSNPGVYRVVNPYANNSYISSTGDYDDSQTYYMIVDCSNPEAVSIPEFDTGVNYGGMLRIYAASDGSRGKLADDIVTFPEWGLKYKKGEGSWEVCNWKESFCLYLPGAKDYSFTVDGGECVWDNKTSISYTVGADIAEVKYGCFKGRSLSASSFQSSAAASDLRLDLGKEEVEVSLPDDGPYTFFAIAYDADGNVQATGSHILYRQSDDPDQWTPLGDAVFTESIVSVLFGIDPAEVEIAIEESKTKKGLYRLVNPLSKNVYAGYNDHNCHDSDPNHYLYIDATDPNRVYVKDCILGFDLGYGSFTLSSAAGLAESRGESISSYDSEYFGVLADQVITIPSTNVYLSMLGYQNAGFFSMSNDLKVVLPSLHTVTIGTNADAKYGKVIFDSAEDAGNVLQTTMSKVNVSAIPAEGVRFINWTDATGKVLSTDSAFTYVGSVDATLTANFGFAVKVKEVKHAKVTVSDGDKTVSTIATPGAKLTVKVDVETGYDCTGLNVNGNILEGSTEFTVDAESDLTIEACIKAIELNASVKVVGNGEVQTWTAVGTDGSPVAPELGSEFTIGFDSFVALYLIPGKTESGDYETVESVTAATDGGEPTAIDFVNEFWDSEWRPGENIIVGELQVKANVVYTITFSGTASSAIAGIEADDSNATAVYYNLQGVKVDGRNLPAGIYIVRQGCTTRKVVVND